MALVLATPERTEPVDLLDRFVDAVLRAEPCNRFSTGAVSVVVDNQKATDRKTRIQIHESIHRRLVEVAVEPNNRPGSVPDRWQRVLEPSLEKPDAIIEQPVEVEVARDLFFRYCERFRRVEPAPCVRGIIVDVGRWNAGKR